MAMVTGAVGVVGGLALGKIRHPFVYPARRRVVWMGIGMVGGTCMGYLIGAFSPNCGRELAARLANATPGRTEGPTGSVHPGFAGHSSDSQT